MKLTILGTGNAQSVAFYNTCFVVSGEGGDFLVDAGGGNGVFKQFKEAGLKWQDMREIFLTHEHTDHILGMVWMVRMISQGMSRGSYDGDAVIYGHAEVLQKLRAISEMIMEKKAVRMFDDRLHFVPVEDGETRTIIGRPVTFFDIGSTKAKQFGFSMIMDDGRKLTCCGDEPYNVCEEPYAAGADWLLHEAFCLYSEADIFRPYTKNHSAVKDACELAESLGVPHLVLYHTEDSHGADRGRLYLEEGRRYYSGDLHVPEDLEVIELV